MYLCWRSLWKCFFINFDYNSVELKLRQFSSVSQANFKIIDTYNVPIMLKVFYCTKMDAPWLQTPIRTARNYITSITDRIRYGRYSKLDGRHDVWKPVTDKLSHWADIRHSFIVVIHALIVCVLFIVYTVHCTAEHYANCIDAKWWCTSVCANACILLSVNSSPPALCCVVETAKRFRMMFETSEMKASLPLTLHEQKSSASINN